MPNEVVIDTTILVAANQMLTAPPRANSRFRRRLDLLAKLRKGVITVLISERLLHEYKKQIPRPRNDFVDTFFKLLLDSGGAIYNYAQWRGGDRQKARNCRFPREDDHVLRTAWRDNPSTILTEEQRMLNADACIYREFRVHIRDV